MVQQAMRADAQRNRDRILDAAEIVVSRDGAAASLEEIARTAGVGSATLHRHFSSRWELLDAVFTDRVSALCEQAELLAATKPAGVALAEWLRVLTIESGRNHGLAASMFPEASSEHSSGDTCHAKIQNAGQLLLGNAIAEGTVRPEVSFPALFQLISAIVTSTDGRDVAENENESMISLVLYGIYAAGAV
jgi:AcrR family transcriptional regulator